MTDTSNADEGNPPIPGGAKTIELIVSAMYFHITSDPRVAHFFADAPMNRILDHQRAFLIMALTGAPVYGGRSLTDAHARLVEHHGLTERHFDIVLEHLVTTMSELGIEPGLARRIERKVTNTKPLVFGMPPDAPSAADASEP